jgi:hypothetical protein
VSVGYLVGVILAADGRGRRETVVDGIEAFAAWVRSRPGDDG